MFGISVVGERAMGDKFKTTHDTLHARELQEWTGVALDPGEREGLTRILTVTLTVTLNLIRVAVDLGGRGWGELLLVRLVTRLAHVKVRQVLQGGG